MNYKYRKGQIFGKRLEVPKNILDRIYRGNLSFREYIEYELDDKIPITCLAKRDRRIVKKFGIEKAKTLDWELLNKYGHNIDFRQLLMSIDASVEDLNTSLYELVKDQIRPSDYSSRMKSVYQDRLFEISQEENEDTMYYKKWYFNEGEVSLVNLISNWDLYKNKDLSYCLQSDDDNEFNITDIQVKDFMNKFGNIARLILDSTNIYQFIYEINSQKSESEKQEYIKQITDSILEKTIKKDRYQQVIELSNDEYNELFKYSSMQEYLKRVNQHSEYVIDKMFEELKTLPQGYDIPIPLDILKKPDVLTFIVICGLKNIIDFDNECGHFFTKNNCQMLKEMSLYLTVYSGYGIFSRRDLYGENERPYTKDEFYEVMKKMITARPNDISHGPLDYRDITGEFREKNAQLFISEQAPEELQNLFYTKSITPRLLVEHPDYIPYLKGKDLETCFSPIYITLAEGGYKNLYNFIGEKTDFNGVMNFITEYCDVFDTILNEKSTLDGVEISKEDTIDEIQKRINEAFKKFIIEKGVAYPKIIPQSLIANYPSMFLSEDAPKELQEAFYNRTINSEFILSNESYKEFLKDVELEVLFKYMPVDIVSEEPRNSQVNLVSAIKQTFGFEDGLDIMLSYGKYIEWVFEANKLRNFRFDPSSKDDLLNALDSTIMQAIIDGEMKYSDENISNHFKDNNPTLFLNQNVPQDIRNKFYNREFTLNDFNANPELLDIFGDTNVVCGFSASLSWMIPLFNDLDNSKMANENRLKVISEFLKVEDVGLRNDFKEFIIKSEKINLETISEIADVLSSLSLTNSSELNNFRYVLANQLLNTSNPIESFNKIENIFIKNHLPIVGKIYSCFEILHPDFQGFNFDDYSMISPVLKRLSTMGKKITVFSDLIKSAFGSNNKSVNAYLKNIEIGSKLYESIKSGQIQYDSLNESQKNELIIFSKHLATLYNNTMKGKKETDTFTTTGDTLTDILELSKKLSPDGTIDYNLADRVIKMFCGFAGIDTLEQAKSYINQKIKTADARNRKASNSEMVLEKGDFIKGIGDITYLRNILQNGSVSKEYLGANADSDATPLDTDVSMIESDGSIKDKIDSTAARGYGPIWFVLKNDDRFITTRTGSEAYDVKNDMSKMEVFYTGVLGSDHYGIRTGVASSEIDYIVMDNYDLRVGLEIAMNGFYIPVANKEGKIVFTPNDYDKLRKQMDGLSYYDENNYTFSENLICEDTEYLASQIEQSNYEVQVKRNKINDIIRKSLEELGLRLKTSIDGDLTEGFVELIDTGSTGRGTNKPGDGDFDFIMRLDRKILSNPQKLEKLKKILLRNFGKENSLEITSSGDFRLKGVQVDKDINVDIDITFTQKTDGISYSTDMALQDRLATIQKVDSEKYKYVVANILLAKQVLKQAGVYKPNRGEVPQGGLGGVGIENWILQNGGSFIDAATSFIKASEGKSFEEFNANYQIWDFGDNHLAEKRGLYPHGEFVANNMSEDGYHKMIQVLKEYMKNYNYSQNSIKR